jgi:transposase InsO family protein
MQIDLMEVRPAGPNGEMQVLTAVDVCTRYLWFRPVTTKNASDVAFALYEIILDAGVVPRVIQSDQGREFFASLMQELIRLLGARQVFSMALHPQTQGVVERLHKELRKVLRMLVDSVLRARPRDWPRWLCLAQAKVRQSEIGDSGATPFACWHGFYGSSQLQSALVSVETVPNSIALDDWVRQLVQDSKEILASAGAALEKAAADRLTAREAHAHPRHVEVGSLVVVESAFFEKDLKRLVSNCDGPFMVISCDDHGAVLADPVTQVDVSEVNESR